MNAMKLEKGSAFAEYYRFGTFHVIIQLPYGIDFGSDAFNWEVRSGNGNYIKSGNASTKPAAQAAAIQIIESM